ncbi:PLP-dependent aminotransferase family protein [Thermodesulfobacteriota bacterium]
MINIKTDRDSDQPIYAQIRDAVIKAIKEGSLNPGDRLPAVTAFAKMVGVTHSTIRRALKDLIASGHVVSHVGRGTFVDDPFAPERETKDGKTPLKSHPSPQVSHEFTLAARRLRMGITKSLEDLMDLARRPGLISFTAGIPDPGIMEPGTLDRLVKDALKAGQETYQVYGGPALGMTALREILTSRFKQDGINISPDQILITSGSQQAVSIVAQAALENKQRIICETPCYMGIPNAFGALGHWVESAPRDWEGPIPDRLNHFNDKKPSVFYLCPELHNPMGTDISPERQTMLIKWSREQDVEIIADEIFHDLRFEGPAPVSIFSEAGTGNVVVIGSLSKSFMLGLRIGWLITSPEKIRSFVSLKRAMDLGCPPLMQGIALSLLRSGEYDIHLEKAHEHYRLRRDTAIETLEREMPDGVTWTLPKGGFHMWLELPNGYSSIALFLHAIERGVAFFPGPMQDVDHRFINAFRLSYGSVTPEEIEKGVKLLADAVKALIKEPPRDPGLSGLGDFL